MEMLGAFALLFSLTALVGASNPAPEVAQLADEVRARAGFFPARSEQGDWELFLASRTFVVEGGR